MAYVQDFKPPNTAITKRDVTSPAQFMEQLANVIDQYTAHRSPDYMEMWLDHIRILSGQVSRDQQEHDAREALLDAVKNLMQEVV